MLKEISLAAIFVATMGASTAMANEHFRKRGIN